MVPVMGPQKQAGASGSRPQPTSINMVFALKACSNEANIMQHCWANNVVHCWMKILSNFKLKPTSSNIIQRSVQTRPTCCIQQCWMMLDQRVSFVSTGLDIVVNSCATKHRFMRAFCWKLFHEIKVYHHNMSQQSHPC